MRTGSCRDHRLGRAEEGAVPGGREEAQQLLPELSFSLAPSQQDPALAQPRRCSCTQTQAGGKQGHSMTKDGNPNKQGELVAETHHFSVTTYRTAGPRPQKCWGDLGLGQLSLGQDKSQLRARDLLVILYIHYILICSRKQQSLSAQSSTNSCLFSHCSWRPSHKAQPKLTLLPPLHYSQVLEWGETKPAGGEAKEHRSD